MVDGRTDWLDGPIHKRDSKRERSRYRRDWYVRRGHDNTGQLFRDVAANREPGLWPPRRRISRWFRVNRQVAGATSSWWADLGLQAGCRKCRRPGVPDGFV